jgi:hypothetical protein
VLCGVEVLLLARGVEKESLRVELDVLEDDIARYPTVSGEDQKAA